MISGGGWHMESRQSMLDFSALSAELLRKQGFAVASVDYRVTGEKGITVRHIISDCFDGLRYLAVHADVLGIDPYHVVTSGHSAGAHLALMLGYAPQEKFRVDSVLTAEFRICAVASFSAPVYFHEDEHIPQTHGLGDLNRLFGASDSLAERKAASPASYTDTAVPTLLCAGTADSLVYAVSSELLYRDLREKGIPSRLVLSQGGGHCFEAVNEGETPSVSFEETQKIAAEFILSNAF